MKKILIIAIVVLAAGLVAFTLINNKEAMKEQAALAQKTSDFIPVELNRVEKKTVTHQFSASGTFEAKSDLRVLSETQGQIVKVYKEKGARVKKGEMLARVESEDLKANAEAAQSSLSKLQADKKRFTRLADSNAVTQRQLEDVTTRLENARAQYQTASKRLDKTRIRAPETGQIDEDYIQEGSYISSGTKLYDIVNLSVLKLNVKVTAEQVLYITEGDSVKITTSIFPGTAFSGRVTAIASKADEALKYNVELKLKNNGDKKPKAGMYATAHFSYSSGKPGLYLNRNALVGSIQNPEVFVIKDSTAHRKSITVGTVRNEEMEIIKGLSEGEHVIVSGQINLEEGIRVKALKNTGNKS